MQTKPDLAAPTDRERAVLAEAAARFRTIFQSAPVGIVLADLDSDAIIEANEAYCAIVGRSRDEIMRHGWKNLTHPDDVAASVTSLDRLRRGEQDAYRLNKRYLRPDGEVVWAELDITRIESQDPDVSPQYLVIVTDITERKHFLEQLEQKNSELERFTYTVSHELKSPLVTINGFLGLLNKDLDAGDDEMIDKDMRMISTAVETMAAQLDNLLELSRIGRIVHPSKTFEFAAVCDEVLDRLSGVIGERAADIRVAPVMPRVHADRVRIREVVQNLVENAIKFGRGPNPPRIEIDARVESDYVLCRIRDDGPGIEPRYHRRVFELFERLDNSVAGTGIGLALVKRSVEIHGGKIWIESCGDGRGTCFCFTLPAA